MNDYRQGAKSALKYIQVLVPIRTYMGQVFGNTTSAKHECSNDQYSTSLDVHCNYHNKNT